MKTALFGLCCFLLLASPCLANNSDDLAIAAASNFAEIVNDGNIAAAYWIGSPLLRLANVEQNWIDAIARRQRVLGKVLVRQLRQIRVVSSPPELPDDDYRIILYDAKTEYKAEAAEVILLHKVAELWQVCAYSIR